MKRIFALSLSLFLLSACAAPVQQGAGTSTPAKPGKDPASIALDAGICAAQNLGPVSTMIGGLIARDPGWERSLTQAIGTGLGPLLVCGLSALAQARHQAGPEPAPGALLAQLRERAARCPGPAEGAPPQGGEAPIDPQACAARLLVQLAEQGRIVVR
jgi:hypothetical protein